MAKSKSAKGKKLVRTTSYKQHQVKKQKPHAHYTVEAGKVTENVSPDTLAWGTPKLDNRGSNKNGRVR